MLRRMNEQNAPNEVTPVLPKLSHRDDLKRCFQSARVDSELEKKFRGRSVTNADKRQTWTNSGIYK